MTLQRLRYELSAAGVYALVPLVCVGALLPLGLLVAESSSPQLTSLYLDSAMLLAPVFAAWWPTFVFRERVEGEGRELLYLLAPRGHWLVVLLLALLFGVVLVPLLAVAYVGPGLATESAVIVLSRSVLVACVAFMTTILMRSGALGLVVTVLVALTSLGPLEGLAGSRAAAVELLLSALGLLVGEVMGNRFMERA